MEDIIKIVKSLEDSSVLLKGVTETIRNEAKEQRGEFLSTLLGTVGASLLGNTFTGKGINGVAKRFIRAGYGSKTRTFNRTFNTTSYLILKYRSITKMNLDLMEFVLEIIYQTKWRMGGTYVINLDDYSDIGTHWTVLYAFNKNVIYFYSFGVEHIPKEIKKMYSCNKYF